MGFYRYDNSYDTVNYYWYMLSYNYVNAMKIYLKILSTTLSLVFLSHEALAGTTMQNLSKSIQYVELDKIEEQRKEALEASQNALSKD